MKKLLKNKKVNYYLLYTLAFILCCLGVFFRYYSADKTFIYTGDNGDGWVQHYKAYIYYSKYLKEIFRNLFVNHNFVIPQWDFSIGEGADILGTLHYYVIGDPIAFLSILVPEEYIYAFYDFASILRLYLSGIFFSWLCFYTKKENKYAVLAGTIVYVFCYWSFISSTRHIYFMNPMMYLPLVILGVEKIINNDKPYLLTIAVLLSSLSNFYYFYNIVLLTVVYVAVRLLVLYKKDIKQIINKLLIIFKYSIFGVLLSAVILLPVLKVFLGDSRMSIDFNTHATYPISYYLDLPSTFLSTKRNYWLCMGFASPVLFALIVTLLRFKKEKFMFYLEIAMILFVLFPIFGQIFNGLSYISNKWCFGFALFAAYNFVAEWDEIKKYKLLLLIMSSILFVGFLVMGSNANINVPMILSILFALCLFELIKNKHINQMVMIVIICVNVIFNANNFYKEFSKSATTSEDSKNIFYTSEAYVIKDNIANNKFYRYSGNNLTQNASVLFNTNSTDFYWSLNNPYMSVYRDDMQLTEVLLQKYKEYDKRSPLYTLANVKYYITDSNSNELIPYGFTFNKTIDEYDLYINDNYLPFGYTYENAISYDEWNKLSAIKKQEALLDNIVIKNGGTNINVNNIEEYYFSIVPDGVEIKNSTFESKEEQSSIVLNFDSICDRELYITITGLEFDDGKNWLKSKTESSSITVSSPLGYDVELPIYTADSRYYNGRKDFTFYLGYCDRDINQITIYLEDKGTYYYDEIIVSSINMADYNEKISKLKLDVLENVEFNTNEMSGSITIDSDKYLLLTIPYSKGWKAYVDGKQVEVLNANEAYSALYLESGQHNIVMKYETPLLRLGLLISLLSLVLFVVDIIYKRNKKKC